MLLYHSVSGACGYHFSVSPEDFAWQMEWLHRGGVCVQSLPEALAWNGSPPGPRRLRVVISFDDGYADNFTAALPVLRKYGYKAVFFIATGHVGQTNSWEDDRSIPQMSLMNWEMIKTLSDEGHIIGGHTHRHINLLAATDTGRIKADLEESFRLLREKTGREFIPLAYPYGKYSAAVIPLIKEIGYSCAVTAGGFWGNNMRTSRWELRREDITRSTTRRIFAAQVRGIRDREYVNLGIRYFKET